MLLLAVYILFFDEIVWALHLNNHAYSRMFVFICLLESIFYPVSPERPETMKRSRKLEGPASVVSHVVVRELTHRQSMQSDPRVRAE